MKNHFQKAVIFILSASALILYCACDKTTDATGFLEGKITIGPICPVERIPPDPACLPTAETYKSYPVSIWSSDEKKKIGALSSALDGSYKIELPEGKYRVILEKDLNGVGGSNLPSDISISADNTTTLNIDIDTGIR